MSANQPPAKKQKLSLASMQITTIKVLVGKDETSFSLYKHHLCAESVFFERACKDYWTCDQEVVVRLVEDEPKLFGIFVAWLLAKDIEQAEDLIEVTGTDTRIRYLSFLDRFRQLMRLFVLAQTLQAENFQNAVMDLILTSCSRFYSEGGNVLTNLATDIKFSYDTLPKSPLRQVILDSNRTKANFNVQITRIFEEQNSQNSDSDLSHQNTWAQEYLAELLNIMARGNEGQVAPWKRDRCVYHEYRDKPEDYSCTQTNSQSALDQTKSP